MTQSLKFLFGILDDHNGECLKEKCLCHQAESIVWILNQNLDQNQQLIELSSEDVEFLNSVAPEPLYASDQYYNASFTFNDYQDKKYLLIKSNPTYYKKESTLDVDELDFQIEEEKEEGDNNSSGNNSANSFKKLKIDPQRLKQAFFANFIRQYFEQAIQKFPNSYEIKICYAHFVLYQLKNMFLCMNILKEVNVQKLSFLERCSFLLNEAHMISEIYNDFINVDNYNQGFEDELMGVINLEKVKQKLSDEFKQIDPEDFLYYAKLQEYFNQSTLKLSKHILAFWALIQEKAINVSKIIEAGFCVADDIAETYDVFKKMDDASKHKNEKIYYHFALIHQQLLNDNQTFSLYIQKMKHVINMKKFIKKNFQQMDSFYDYGVILVSGKSENFGKIMEVNRIFQKITGYNSLDLKYGNFEIIMNDMVKQWHDYFVKDFMKSGQRIMLDKKLNQFLKKKNGYITPVQIVIKNHYSKIYEYSYIAFINTINEIQLDGSQSMGISVNNLMLLLCDNNDGKVYNVCKNTSKVLGLKKQYLIKNSSYLDFEIKLNQISPALDIQKFKDLQKLYNSKENIFYGIFKLDLNVIKQKASSRFQAAHYVDARFKIFTEQYHNKKYEMNILVIHLLQGNQPYHSSGLTNFSTFNNGVYQEEISNQQDESQKVDSDLVSSSSSDSSKQTDLIKNQSISMEKKTPRNLKVVIQLLLLMFFTMIGISSINLFLSRQRGVYLKDQIVVYEYSSVRMTTQTRTRLAVTEMIYILAGLAPNKTDYIEDRYKYYRDQLFKSQEDYRKSQNFLDSSNNLFSQRYQDFMNDKNCLAYYLDENGRVYTNNHTLAYLTSIYISKLLEVYNFNKTQMTGRLKFQTLTPPKEPFKPTPAEQTLFFVIQNSNEMLGQQVWTIDTLYHDEIVGQIANSLDQTEITIIVSISTIVLVFIVITPILSVLQDRQYTSIIFFIDIPKEKLEKIIQQVSICYDQLILEEENQVKDKKKVLNEESQLNSIANNSMVMEQFLQQNNYQSEMSQNNTSQMSQMNHTKHENTISDIDILVSNGNRKQEEVKVEDNNLKPQYLGKSTFASKAPEKEQPRKSWRRSVKRPALIEKFAQQMRKYSDSHSSNSQADDQSEKGKSPQKLQNLGDKKEEEDEDQQLNYEEIQAAKRKNIQDNKTRRRCRVVMIGVFSMLLFCIYFIGSFLMSRQTFLDLIQAIDESNWIYNKDMNMEISMIYLRQNYIQNQSYQISLLPIQRIWPQFRGKSFTASTYFIQESQRLERGYLKLRKKDLIQFEQGKDYFEKLDTDQLCPTVFEGDDIERCRTMYNGVLKQGISNTVSIILSTLTQYDLSFNSNRNRTLEQLQQYFKDKNLNELIDFKATLLQRVFEKWSVVLTETNDYFLQTQMTQYIIFFVSFILIIAILIIIVFGVLLRKTRDYLWKINLIMKILPIEDFTKEQLMELKKFFKNQ